MADIRINALATTAASTASDDFVAVDGSANGTRKLNAYSPTFGGNLTVSGTANVGNLLTVTGSGTETGVATAKVGASALGGIPRVNLINATNAVNGKYGDIINTAASGNGAFQFRFIDDAITAATAVLSITGRQGATDSFVTAPGTGAHTFGTTNTVTMTNGVLATTGAGTIGGNLTVSGTGNVTGQLIGFANAGTAANFGSIVAANATLNAVTSYSASASTDQKYWAWQAGTAVGDGTFRLRALNDTATNGINALTFTRSGISSIAATLNGNLTVSGTGNSSVAGKLFISKTTPDSSNGVLQLADHNVVTGGIGFGADTALYRDSQGKLRVESVGGGTVSGVAYYINGTNKGQSLIFNDSLYLDTNTAGASIILRTGATTTALTLDSSQTATFANQVKLGTGKILYFDGGINTYLQGSSGSLFIGTNGAATLTLDSSQNATFAGTVQLNSDSGLYIKQGNIARWTSTGLSSGTARADIYADSAGSFFIRTNGATQALQINSSQNATFAGSIATAAPTTGTAGAWKLGVKVDATTTLDTTKYLQVDIGGTLYKVALVTS